MLDRLGIPLRCYIRDPILGFIPIYEHEYRILQLPEFNRLHYIKQTGMLYYVYPCAKHSRFEHCIGVMHISGRIMTIMLDRLLGAAESIDDKLDIAKILLNRDNDEISSLLRDVLKRPTEHPIVSLLLDILPTYVVLYERLAGLLHDIGHIAFGHVTEGLLMNLIENDDKGSREFKEFNCKPHEYMTFKLIEHSNNLDTILKSIPKPHITGLGVRRETLMSILAGRLINKKNIELSEGAIKFMHSIIAGDIDADRLDFILRDAYFAGISSLVDIDRIIEGYHPHITDALNIKVAHSVKTLAALENFIFTRIKMYEQVYYHHKGLAYSIITEEIVRTIKKRELLKDFLGIENMSELITAICCEDPYLLTDDDFIRRLDIMLKRLESNGIKDNEVRRLKYYVKCLKDRRYLPVSILKRRGEVPIIRSYIEKRFRHEEIHEVSDEHIRSFLIKLEQILKTALNRKKIIGELKNILNRFHENVNSSDITIFCRIMYVKVLEKFPSNSKKEIPTPLVKTDKKIEPLIRVSPLIRDLRKNFIYTPLLYVYLAYTDPACPLLYNTFIKKPELKEEIRNYLKRCVEKILTNSL